MMAVIKNLYQKYREVLLYLVFGVLTTAVNLAVYLLCRTLLPDTSWRMAVASVISWFLSVLFAWITNRTMVFRSAASTPGEILREALTFFSARLVTGGLDIALLYGATILLGLDDRLVKLASNVLVIILNYVFSKLWIFRKKKEA